MRAISLFVVFAGAVACGGSDGEGDRRTTEQMPKHMEGPPCRNWSDCEDYGCVVPATVPFGTETEGVCYSGPYTEDECRRVVENGVVTAEDCA